MEDIVVDNVFSALYMVKIARYACVCIAAYAARVLFVNRYIDRKVYDNKTPPPTTTMVNIFATVAVCMEMFIAGCLALAASAQQANTVPLVPVLRDPMTIAKYVVDATCTLIITVTVSAVIGRIIGSRMAFDYVDNGDRAARTFESIVRYVAFAVYSVPFFLMV